MGPQCALACCCAHNVGVQYCVLRQVDDADGLCVVPHELVPRTAYLTRWASTSAHQPHERWVTTRCDFVVDAEMSR